MKTKREVSWPKLKLSGKSGVLRLKKAENEIKPSRSNFGGVGRKEIAQSKTSRALTLLGCD